MLNVPAEIKPVENAFCINEPHGFISFQAQ